MKVLKCGKSEIQLDEFNNCPGGEYVANILNERSMQCVDVQFIDGDKRENWSNGEDTLVACLPEYCGRSHAAAAAFEMGALGDESEMRFGDDGKIYFWVWWD